MLLTPLTSNARQALVLARSYNWETVIIRKCLEEQSIGSCYALSNADYNQEITIMQKRGKFGDADWEHPLLCQVDAGSDF